MNGRLAFPFQRDIAGLKSGKKFDVLVVGGGIYGAWAAYDAALRGLSVALIEKNDWGSGTSQSSSKLIHGGLRYLENFEFSLVRHALIERRILARNAPHLVRPINFVLPQWQGSRVNSLKLKAGLMLYDWLSMGWQPVQHHKYFKRDRLLSRYPFLAEAGLQNGFRYGDCQEDDARLTMVVAAAAHGAGAYCANHLEASHIDHDGKRANGAQVVDKITGEQFSIRAKTVIATSGPWLPGLTRQSGVKMPAVKLVKGVHLVMPQIPNCHSAFLLTAPQDGRVFFVIPWYNRTLIGTTESEVKKPEDAVVTDDEVRYLLSSANAWMPGLGWTEKDVISSFAGTRTLQAQEAGSLSAVTREFEITSPLENLILPIGGKYTTARFDASLLVDKACAQLKSGAKCITHKRLLPGAPEDYVNWFPKVQRELKNAGFDEECARSIAQRYGTLASDICALGIVDSELIKRVSDDCPMTFAEVTYARSHEMALTDDDVLRRRVPLQLLSQKRENSNGTVSGK